MRVLVDQGEQYMPDANYIATSRPEFFTEQYREKVVKYINEVRSCMMRLIGAPMASLLRLPCCLRTPSRPRPAPQYLATGSP